jgi:pyrimidine-specific ribonucleoside hydrolase
METGDPDDFLTLLMLLDHPRVELRAVTITPGAPDQVGLVRRALEWMERTELPVGARNLDHPKEAVSKWHYSTFGRVPPSRDAEPADELLLSVLDASTTLLTGGPPKNLGNTLELAHSRGTPLSIGRWVAQGGFAGEGVVPPDRQLAKFRGLTICPSFNLNGAPQAVLAALAAPEIGRRRFVSKNVCHGVIYDRAMHERFSAAATRRRSIELVHKAMGRYLARHSGGKAFHDPLAAACAIDESIADWAEIKLYRERGAWGSRLSPSTGTRIIISYDHERFLATLLA